MIVAEYKFNDVQSVKSGDEIIFGKEQRMIFLELTLATENEDIVPILVNPEQIQSITKWRGSEPGQTWITLADRSFVVEETFDDVRALLIEGAKARVIY